MIRKKTYKQRKARAIKTLKQYRNPDGTQKETGIERRMRVLLDTMGAVLRAGEGVHVERQDQDVRLLRNDRHHVVLHRVRWKLLAC